MINVRLEGGLEALEPEVGEEPPVTGPSHAGILAGGGELAAGAEFHYARHRAKQNRSLCVGFALIWVGEGGRYC